MKQGVVSITEQGRLDYDTYRQLSLHFTILDILRRKALSMYDLTEEVRHSRDSFRFIQPREIVRVIVELQKNDYVENTYQ